MAFPTIKVSGVGIGLLFLTVGYLMLTYPRLAGDFAIRHYNDAREYLYLLENNVIPTIFPYNINDISPDLIKALGAVVAILGICHFVTYRAVSKIAEVLSLALLGCLIALIFPYSSIKMPTFNIRLLLLLSGIAGVIISNNAPEEKIDLPPTSDASEKEKKKPSSVKGTRRIDPN
jgi:hypothetical protein